MKKNVCKFKFGVSGLFLFVLFVGLLIIPDYADAVKWKLGVPTSLESAQAKAANEVAKLISERTKGQIKIDVFPGGQLGPWTEVFDSTMRGTVEMSFSPISPQFHAKLQIVYMVYLVRNWDDGLQAYAQDGWIFKFLQPLFEDMGLKPLGFSILGFGGYGSKIGPVVKPEDITTLKSKTRVPLLTTELFFKKLGPTINISFSELFTSLQTGVVDAQDNSPSVTYLQLRDVTKYYTTINHLFEPLVVIMNKKLWDDLKPDIQKIVRDTVVEVLLKYNKSAEEEEEEFLKKMVEHGVKVVRLTPEQRQLWRTIGRDSWNEMAKEIGQDTIDYIKKHVEKYE